MRTAALLAALLLSASSLPAAERVIRRLDNSTISPAAIDATVNRLMAAAEVAGVGISIVTNGKIVFEKAYGFRDTGKKLPLTEDSVLAAASFMKVGFTYLVMKLVQEGALRFFSKTSDDVVTFDIAADGRAAQLVIHTGGKNDPGPTC